MKTEKQTLKLDQMRIDGGTQPRVAIDEQTVSEYAEQYSNGVDLKPVVVFFDGATYWLADGFHRYWANKKIKSDYIYAHVHQGTQRDAILYSVGANATHGLRRTNADKRKAVLTMLTEPKVSKDETGTSWSDHGISRQCRVSAPFVAKMRSTLQGDLTVNVNSDEPAQQRAYKSKHGTTAVMNTSKIGRKRQSSQGGGGRTFGSEMNPVRQPRPALAQTHLNLPHDPVFGARAIVSAMGVDYAYQLIDSLSSYLNEQKEGAA